jgi:hypothetical protein
VLPHTPSTYRHLSSHLARARQEGRFPDLIEVGCGLGDFREPALRPSLGDLGMGKDRVEGLLDLVQHRLAHRLPGLAGQGGGA